jgi:hypothetical protein
MDRAVLQIQQQQLTMMAEVEWTQRRVQVRRRG